MIILPHSASSRRIQNLIIAQNYDRKSNRHRPRPAPRHKWHAQPIFRLIYVADVASVGLCAACVGVFVFGISSRVEADVAYTCGGGTHHHTCRPNIERIAKATCAAISPHPHRRDSQPDTRCKRLSRRPIWLRVEPRRQFVWSRGAVGVAFP